MKSWKIRDRGRDRGERKVQMMMKIWVVLKVSTSKVEQVLQVTPVGKLTQLQVTAKQVVLELVELVK